MCHETPSFGATAWHAGCIDIFSAKMRSSTRRTTRSFASWSNFLGMFQIFPSTQTEQNLGHFTVLVKPPRLSEPKVSSYLAYLSLRLRARCKAAWIWASATFLPRCIVGWKENKSQDHCPHRRLPPVLPKTTSPGEFPLLRTFQLAFEAGIHF